MLVRSSFFVIRPSTSQFISLLFLLLYFLVLSNMFLHVYHIHCPCVSRKKFSFTLHVCFLFIYVSKQSFLFHAFLHGSFVLLSVVLSLFLMFVFFLVFFLSLLSLNCKFQFLCFPCLFKLFFSLVFFKNHYFLIVVYPFTSKSFKLETIQEKPVQTIVFH